MPRPRLMGVVNATPDSFSDGGRYLDPGAAVARGLELVADGADVVDVGGESTRPGSNPVPEDVERDRVIPVVRGLARETKVPISVDTTKARVAAEALEAGATWINDVSAGRFDPEMLPLVADAGCTYVAMHLRGTPRTMQAAPRYADPVAEVRAELEERALACLVAGIARERLVLDPGIGFAKRLEDNLALIRNLPALAELGFPLLVGVSRKSFLGTLLGGAPAEERVFGTAAAVTACVLGGADWLRVHDVREMRDVVRVAAALHDVGAQRPHVAAPEGPKAP